MKDKNLHIEAEKQEKPLNYFSLFLTYIYKAFRRVRRVFFFYPKNPKTMKNRFLDFPVKMQNQIVLQISERTAKPINVIGQALENVNPSFDVLLNTPTGIVKRFVPLLFLEVEKLEKEERRD